MIMCTVRYTHLGISNNWNVRRISNFVYCNRVSSAFVRFLAQDLIRVAKIMTFMGPAKVFAVSVLPFVTWYTGS